MPSLLENLQRRLDDLPIPDILHRSHSSQPQEPAAGLEASPRLRVRAFSQRAQTRQHQAPAAAPLPGLQSSQPSQQQQNRQLSSAARQPQLVSRPTWNTHAEPPAVRQGILASDDWPADLPDTPEAPRASTAAQRQAVADVLFEAAAGESAVGDNETVNDDPSWLDDAAAYDAAVAEMDEDDMSALEILSDGDDDDSPVHAMRSQARLNLSSLEHLLLSDNEDERGSATGSPIASDRQGMTAQVAAPGQFLSMMDVMVLDSEEEEDGLPPLVARSTVSSSQQAVQSNVEKQQAEDAVPGSSPPEMARGHNGLPRAVLSDVTSRFPIEQQLPQQLTEEGDYKPEENTFQLQRRGRQPRVCRSILSNDPATAAGAAAAGAAASNSVDASSSSNSVSADSTSDGPVLRPVLRSSARSQAMQSAPQSSEASGAESQAQTTRCTRRQAKLNKQSSQQASQQEQIPHGDLSSDDDFAVLGRSQRQGRTAAAANASSLPSSSGLAHGRNQPTNSVTQAGTAEQAFGVRKIRPRLQLNRNPGRKGADGMGTASEAAAGLTALNRNVS